MPASKPSEILASQVRRWRDRRGLSTQDLADRLAEIGSETLNRRSVSKIENRERGVSLDEWIELAHVLAVPPPLLFLDLESGGDVAVAPSLPLHPWLVWEWATGQHAPITADRRITRVEEFSQARLAIDLYQEQRAASDAVSTAEAAIRAATFAGEDVKGPRARYAEALKRLADALNEMVENGVRPPALSPERVEAMVELRLLKYVDQVSKLDEL